jgi:hypothetical protein
MDKKSRSRHSHRLELRDLRWLILMLAVTCALAYWALFSNKFGKNDFAAVSGNGQLPDDIQPVETGAQLVIDLPPMPTLIPTLDPASVEHEQAMGAVQSSDPVSVPGTSVQPPVKIFLGGSKPSTQKVTTVTVTRSSR